MPGSTDTAASFEFEKEDHTLGNALRYVIMKKSVLEALGAALRMLTKEQPRRRVLRLLDTTSFRGEDESQDPDLGWAVLAKAELAEC